MPEHLIRFLNALYACRLMASRMRSCWPVLSRTTTRRSSCLSRRHAALVWRTCRAIVRDHHAAEDAFQATFLALATKASSVRGSVAGWLYRVAYHAALKARKTRDHAGPVPEIVQTEPAADSADLSALLHDELARVAGTLPRPRDPVPPPRGHAGGRREATRSPRRNDRHACSPWVGSAPRSPLGAAWRPLSGCSLLWKPPPRRPCPRPVRFPSTSLDFRKDCSPP